MYSRMDQVKFVEDNLCEIWRPYHFKFFKGCLPHILLGPFLNTLIPISMKICPENLVNPPSFPSKRERSRIRIEFQFALHEIPIGLYRHCHPQLFQVKFEWFTIISDYHHDLPSLLSIFWKIRYRRQILLLILTYYSPVLLFYTPWKHQKT